MPLRDFDENQGSTTPDGAGLGEKAADRIARIEALKQALLGGDLSALGLPDEAQPIADAMKPLVKAALNQAIDNLTEQARVVIRAEKEGNPSHPEEWAKFLNMITFYFKIPSNQRLERILAAKIIFLLTGAIEELGRDHDIDPHKHDYK